MSHFRADACGTSSTSTGTGTLALSTTALAGHRTPQAAGVAVSDTFSYYVKHQTLDEWEVGIGTYSATNTLTRTVPIASSNGGSAVNFSAGTKEVKVVELSREVGTLPVEIVAAGPYTLVVGDAAKNKYVTDTSAWQLNLTTAFNQLGCVISWPASAGTGTVNVGAGCNVNGLGDGVDFTLSQAGGSIVLFPTGANTWGAIGAIGDLTVADITDMSANARSFNQAANFGAMRVALNVIDAGTPRAITGATALASGECNCTHQYNSASTAAITVPNDSTLGISPGKATITVFIQAAGVPTFTAGSGVTISGSPRSGLAQNDVIVLVHTGIANTWAYA